MFEGKRFAGVNGLDFLFEDFDLMSRGSFDDFPGGEVVHFTELINYLKSHSALTNVGIWAVYKNLIPGIPTHGVRMAGSYSGQNLERVSANVMEVLDNFGYSGFSQQSGKILAYRTMSEHEIQLLFGLTPRGNFSPDHIKRFFS